MERDKLSIEKEWIRQSLEKERLGLEQYWLDLIRQSKMLGNADNECADESGASVSNDLKMFDVVSHLCLVHMFD